MSGGYLIASDSFESSQRKGPADQRHRGSSGAQSNTPEAHLGIHSQHARAVGRYWESSTRLDEEVREPLLKRRPAPSWCLAPRAQMLPQLCGNGEGVGLVSVSFVDKKPRVDEGTLTARVDAPGSVICFTAETSSIGSSPFSWPSILFGPAAPHKRSWGFKRRFRGPDTHGEGSGAHAPSVCAAASRCAVARAVERLRGSAKAHCGQRTADTAAWFSPAIRKRNRPFAHARSKRPPDGCQAPAASAGLTCARACARSTLRWLIEIQGTARRSA